MTSVFFYFNKLLLFRVFFRAQILGLLFIYSWLLSRFLLFSSDINNNYILIIWVGYYNYLIFLRLCLFSFIELKFLVDNIIKLLFSLRNGFIKLYFSFYLGRLAFIKLFLLNIIKVIIIVILYLILYFAR